MELAEQFNLPVITLVDTAGAYPGIGAEERGQAEAIARSTDCCLSLGVPLVAVVIGEGGSGGAVAIATANRILMLEHAIYTVASPEAAASILWRDSQGDRRGDQHEDHGPGPRPARRHRRRSSPSRSGGAHRDRELMFKATGRRHRQGARASSDGKSPDEIRRQRHERFLQIGH